MKDRTPLDGAATPAERNASYFNSAAPRYAESDLVEHDAAVAWPLYDRIVDRARARATVPRVLDLGAGVGIGSLPMLARGCHVTAVDMAGAALVRLRARAACEDRLVTVVSEAAAYAEHSASQGVGFDIVLCRAFLHHVPDYLEFLRRVTPLIVKGGCFVSLADPLRYDTVTRFERRFAQATYYSMRLFRGNYVRGLRTLLRRGRGVLRCDLAEDNVEYHVVRNGVDQEAIRHLFEESGFGCEIIPYFGWNNPIMTPLGRRLGVRSSFACLATREG